MNYWNEEHEILIKDIINEKDTRKKNKLIENIIPKIKEIILGVFKQYYFTFNQTEDSDLLILEAITLIVIKLNDGLYDPTKAKFYSWCSNSVKNFFFTALVRTSKEKEFFDGALKNHHTLMETNDEHDYHFYTIDKNIENFEIINNIQIAIDHMEEVYCLQRNLSLKKHLRVFIEELEVLKDDEWFTYEKWIINIFKRTRMTGANLQKIFKKLGFNNASIGLISASYNGVYKNPNNYLNGEPEMNKMNPDYKELDITPIEKYQKWSQYYKRYYKKKKDK